MRKFLFLALALAVFAGMGLTSARADGAAPGQPAGDDPWVFVFDENGHGVISIDHGPFHTLNGGLMADPSGSGLGLVLTYLLPSVVAAGDVEISEPAASGGGLSDVIRFTNANGALVGAVADRMIYYSDTSPNDPGTDLADVPHPPNNLGAGAIFPVAIPEIGPEGNNGFNYGPTVSPGLLNTYIGISDTPEPSTMALAGLGALGMIGYAVRRRKAVGA
jgi:hypothetical protein